MDIGKLVVDFSKEGFTTHSDLNTEYASIRTEINSHQTIGQKRISKKARWGAVAGAAITLGAIIYLGISKSSLRNLPQKYNNELVDQYLAEINQRPQLIANGISIANYTTELEQMQDKLKDKYNIDIKFSHALDKLDYQKDLNTKDLETNKARISYLSEQEPVPKYLEEVKQLKDDDLTSRYIGAAGIAMFAVSLFYRFWGRMFFDNKIEESLTLLKKEKLRKEMYLK